MLDKSTSRFYFLLSLIVLFSTLFRLFHYPGPMCFDEQKWILAAQSLIGKEILDISPAYHTRPLWSILLATRATLFGWSWISFEYLVFILSACTVVAVAFAARNFFGDRAGIYSGIVYAFHPINIIYDTAVLPDNLAVFLTAIAFVFFGLFLSYYHTRDLLVSGFLVGLLNAAKSYYVLYAVAFAFAVLVFRSRPAKLWEFTNLTIAALAGFCLSFFLLFLVMDWHSYLQAYSEYSEYVKVAGADADFRKAVHMLLDKIGYLGDLLSNYGQAFGLLTLWTIGVLVSEWREPKPAFLLFAIIMFLIFLMFTPASISPFYFLQSQTRYLTVILVPLSIGSGYALDRLAVGLGSMRLLFPGFLVFAATIVFGSWQPNENWDRYQLMDLAGIRTAMDYARKIDVDTVAVPESYILGVPDALRTEGKEIKFAPIQNNPESDVVHFLMGNPAHTAVYIPRLHYRKLVKDLRVGAIVGPEVDPTLSKTIAALDEAGAERWEVIVPYQSFEARLNDVGIHSRGQLVGWLYRLPGKTPMAQPN